MKVRLPYLFAALALASEQRRNAQRVSLDRMFDLRQILTADEWDALFASRK